jgi:hypothetical protein
LILKTDFLTFYIVNHHKLKIMYVNTTIYLKYYENICGNGSLPFLWIISQKFHLIAISTAESEVYGPDKGYLCLKDFTNHVLHLT